MKPKLVKSATPYAPERAFRAIQDRVYDKLLIVDLTRFAPVAETRSIPRPWERPWFSLGIFALRNIVRVELLRMARSHPPYYSR